MIYAGIITILIIIIDQIIKMLIVNNFSLFENIPLIKNVFNLTYVQNEGAAFNLFNGNTLFLIIMTLIVVTIIFLIIKKLNKKEKIIYSILLGGIIGNLIDRIRLGYVIDYLDFKLINFPIFNLADICIVVSIGILVILSILEVKNEKNKDK
jgi:signal peptidase II